MKEEAVSREEVLDALEECVTASLEMFRTLVEGVTFEGEIDDPGAKELVEDWNDDLKRWYSVLARSGREIGDIPELRMTGP